MDTEELLSDWGRPGVGQAVNGDSATLALIDMLKRSVVGTIRLKGKLEFAAADGAGIVYVNEEDERKIAFVDIGLRKVVKEVALSDCEKPTGIAYDGDDYLVISVCSNGVAKFVSAGTGAEIASLQVGGGADAVIFDEARHVAFFPSGNDGTLTVIAVQGPGKIKVSQTISTMAGSRLGAVDPATGNVYLPAAKFGPPAPPLKLPGLPQFPGMNPGTFEFLVIAPTTRK